MQNSISDLIKGNVVGLTARVLSPYFARVTQGGGIYEAPQCVETGLNSQPLLGQASLVMIPSGYKGGTLYSEIPTNGNGDLTWTRASDGFRTNASGLIQRVPWNLVSNSNDLSQASWSKSNTTITLNSIANPLNGLVNGQTFTPNTTNGLHFAFASGSTTAGQSALMSFFVKANGYTNCRVENAATSSGVWFNLSNGTITSGTGGAITALSDGWYLVSYSSTSTGTSTQPLISFAPSTSLTFAGNGTSGGYVFGAQLVEGTTAQTYLPTTDRLNFPRLSYMYGSCPSVLLEPQRTNLCLWSEDYTNSAWIKGAGVSVTANTTIAPDGNQTADTITFTGSNQLMSQVCLTIGTNVTTSVWLKGTAGETILVNGGGGADVSVTLTTSWQRISFNRPSTTTTSVNISTFGGVTARSVQIWGFQAEIGSYSTTYIPTTSATATRVADTATKTGISSLIGQTEGVIYWEGRIIQGVATDLSIIGTTQDSVFFNLSTTPSLRVGVRANNILVVNATSSTLTGTYFKIALAYKSGDIVAYVNGTQVLTNTQTFTFSGAISEIEIGRPFFDSKATQFNQASALFTTRLTNAQLATLTTL